MSGKIATITVMRDGSKRFPGKNLASFLGIPLYMHTVKFALHLGYPYYLVHNYINLNWTIDSSVKTPLPKANCETGKEIQALNLDADIFVLLQVTSPLRDLAFMKKSIDIFEMSGKQVGVSVHTLNNKYCYMESNKPINFDRKERTYEGTFRSNIWYETGSFYLFTREQVEKDHIMNARPEQIMTFEDRYSVDIDTEEDLKNAERGINQWQ